jgi:endogenous inhibitor of DNA gyrase (YacG/DUF329 family)
MTTAKPRKCPICKRPAEDRWRPFCSKRCADADLARWLGEAYRIPVSGEPDDPDDDEPSPPA